MAKENDTITVYWAPGQFTSDEPYTWNQFYSPPELLASSILQNRQKDPENRVIFACPAYAIGMKNLYQVRAVHDEHVKIPQIFFTDPPKTYPTKVNVEGSRLSFEIPRLASLEGHIDLTYNMSWLFFAEEPVTVRFTAPYFPPKAPAEGTILAMGEFDIGLWFRNFNLDYMVPTGTTNFDISMDDPLFYMQFLTDKKIVFKRYIHTGLTQKYAEEFAQTSNRRNKRYGVGFKDRYELTRKTEMAKLVLNEIKKNLVD